MNTVFHYDQVQNIPDFIIEKSAVDRIITAALYIDNDNLKKLRPDKERLFFVFRDLFEQNVADIFDRFGQIIITDHMVIDRNVG